MNLLTSLAVWNIGLPELILAVMLLLIVHFSIKYIIYMIKSGMEK